MKREKIAEVDLAKVVVAWLQDLQWDVYQEVEFYMYGRRADIVAVQGKLVWIVECKTGFGLSVIEQASYWRYDAHYVSVAVLGRQNNRTSGFGDKICTSLGIGVIGVVKDSQNKWGIIESVAPRLYRAASTKRVLEGLTEEHKTWAQAGNAFGLRYTPFAHTCRNVLKAVEKQPGITLKELMKNLDHHYCSSATARSCISKWGFAGKIKGVEFRYEDGTVKLYPKEESDGSKKTA